MHISIIDDEKILSEKIAKKVRNYGFSASSFFWYEDFMKRGDAKSQLYIVDLSLRDGSGFDIVTWLRDEQKTMAPIIMISGYGDVENKIHWLDSGADDYLIKPFLPEELISRIRAIMRRPRDVIYGKTLNFKDICFDLSKREVSVGGYQVHMTRTEQLILEILLKNIWEIVYREQIIAHVWGSHKYEEVSDNNLSVHIRNIKRKLWGKYAIRTEYNCGYLLEG